MKNEYLSYDALQLAAAPPFIKWIKEGEATHAAVWESWIRDHPEVLPIIEEAQGIVKANFDMIAPLSHAIDTKILWNRIDTSLTKIEEAPLRKVTRLSPLYLSLAIAAALALLLLVFPFFSSETEFSSPKGRHLSYILPDSSSIELNAASTIQFQEKEFAKRREIFLKGEAFFEVEKGDNFLVKTSLGSVKVLGTSFNVFEREGTFEVQCLTGRVEVSSIEGIKKIILRPGEAAKLDASGHLSKENIELQKLATWRQNEFYYEQTPLNLVLEEVKRQYNIEIEFRGIDPYEKIKADFGLNDLKGELEEILWPLHLKFEIVGNKVIITEE